MYKLHHECRPHYFKTLFTENANIHTHNTRQFNLLHPPSCNLNLSKTFIKYRGVLIWNTVVNKVDCKTKPSTFKSSVKSYIKRNQHVISLI